MLKFVLGHDSIRVSIILDLFCCDNSYSTYTRNKVILLIQIIKIWWQYPEL